MAIGASDRVLRSFVALALILLLALPAAARPRRGAYKLGQPYQIEGRWYYPEFDPDYDRVGVASWYGEPFHGRATANGERFDRASVTRRTRPCRCRAWCAWSTSPTTASWWSGSTIVVRSSTIGSSICRRRRRGSSGSSGRAWPRCASVRAPG